MHDETHSLSRIGLSLRYVKGAWKTGDKHPEGREVPQEMARRGSSADGLLGAS